METFSASEISRLAGFEKPVMLNYLERSGTFASENSGPVHHGKKRKYTYRDLVILRAINRLLELGARPKRIQDALSTFGKIASIPKNADELLEFAKASSFFVVTASEVIYCPNAHDVIELTSRGQLAFSFMVESSQSFGAVAATVHGYRDALNRGQPRSRQTLNKCANANGLFVSRPSED